MSLTENDPFLPADETRAPVWPAAARFRAFEWLRALATTDGSPEEAGIALDTWHNTAMDLQDVKAGVVMPKPAGAVPLPETVLTQHSEPGKVPRPLCTVADAIRYGDARDAVGRTDAVPALDSVLRERGLPTVADALGYSRNFAAANPALSQTTRDHIEGLCNMLEIAANHPASAPQQMPTQGEAGGVAWECTGDGLKRYVTDEQYRAFTRAVQRWYKPYHCTNCTPANPPEAGVTDEMVDRLAKHLCREEWKDCCPTMEQMAAQLIHARRYHDEARAMLTAALAPQPKDAT